MAAETAILYDGKRLIPAPQLNFSRNHNRSGDGAAIGTEHTVTLTGTLVGNKGWAAGPDFYDGSDYPVDTTDNKFINIIKMQEKLRDIFGIGGVSGSPGYGGDYKWFEIMGCDSASTPVRKWRARVQNIEFPEGRWTDVCPYIVTLELQTDASTDEDIHLDHSESWGIQFDEEQGGIYTLTHNLSCSSKEFSSDGTDISEGWRQAKVWLDARVAGTDYSTDTPANIKNELIFDSTGFNLGSTYDAYDYVIQRDLDEFGGVYSLSETWTLAKDPVFRQIEIAYEQNRDDYTNVTVSGSFKSFLNRTTGADPTNGTTAQTTFKTWDDANTPYSLANSAFSTRGGCGTLSNCPVSKTVGTTLEERGDGTDTYGASARTVTFSYTFSTAPTTAETVISKSKEVSLLGNCDTNVTISGEIQGHECECSTSKIANARTAYAAINCTTVASNFHTTSTLTQISSSYSEDEVNGTVSFSCGFTDSLTTNIKTEEKMIVAWDCGNLDSAGATKTITSVDGSKQAICDTTLPVVPTPGSYGVSGTLQKTSVTTDEINNSVSWNYEWDSDTGNGLVEITVEVQNGPDDCDNSITTVSLSCQGLGCDSTTMLQNAEAAIAGITPSAHAPSGSCQTSHKTSTNKTRGSVSATYTYTTECDATLDLTITESNDNSSCGSSKYSIDGNIKGRCGATGGAMAVAETLYLSHEPADYSSYGSMLSSSVSRNEKTGTIRFQYEFKETTGTNYEHEQTITVKTEGTNCCGGVNISGTITPFCVLADGDAGLITVANNAWSSIQSGLGTIADNNCSDTLTLSRTSVSNNSRTGEIQYNYEYSCCNSEVTGALNESVTITKEFPSDVVAVIPILGRACGPIVQDKGTKTLEKCTVSVDIQLEINCGNYGKPDGLDTSVDSIISSASCCSDAEGTYTERDTESWNPKTGRYNRTVSFICECC